MKLYRIIFLTLTILLVFESLTMGQNKTYTLTGNFKGLPDGSKVYLTTQEGDTVASTISHQSIFTLSGSLQNNGRFHFIKFDTAITRIPSNAIFVVSGNTIFVNGEYKNPNVKVVGSSSHEDYLDLKELYRKVIDSSFNKAIEPINLAISNLITERDIMSKSYSDTMYYESRIDSCKKIIDKITERHAEQFRPWFKSHKNSLYAPYALEQLSPNLGYTFSQQMYESFPNEVQNSHYGLQLKKSFDILKGKEKIKALNTIPNFTILKPNGEKVYIIDVIKNHKLTLIDMWASWCKPCRAEIPSLKKTYNSFYEKGVNIIGISSDKDQQKWKIALNEDQTPWAQFSEDPNFSILKLFGVKSIPAYLLVDNNGKILSFDCAWADIPAFGGLLRGADLSKTLIVNLQQTIHNPNPNKL